nr:hypothetical protein [Tanacetum cinerariifolium]
MKKRDARLRESWDSNGADKEARMKAMNISLESHSTEMKATFSLWSEDRPNSVSSEQRRAEKLRSFNARFALKREEPLQGWRSFSTYSRTGSILFIFGKGRTVYISTSPIQCGRQN